MANFNGRERIANGLTWDAVGDPKPSLVQASRTFETLAEAQAFVAQFPKYVGMRAATLWMYDVKDGEYRTHQLGYARCDVNLMPNKVTGAANETGLRRLVGMFKTCAKLGMTVTRERKYANSVDFECGR